MVGDCVDTVHRIKLDKRQHVEESLWMETTPEYLNAWWGGTKEACKLLAEFQAFCTLERTKADEYPEYAYYRTANPPHPTNIQQTAKQ